MNDYEQLQQLKTSPRQPLADLVRIEGQLAAEQIRHGETVKAALTALNEIAELPVDLMALGKTIETMRSIARRAFMDIAGCDDVTTPPECEDGQDMPPFLSKVRRDRMREIWKEMGGR